MSSYGCAQTDTLLPTVCAVHTVRLAKPCNSRAISTKSGSFRDHARISCDFSATLIVHHSPCTVSHKSQRGRCGTSARVSIGVKGICVSCSRSIEVIFEGGCFALSRSVTATRRPEACVEPSLVYRRYVSFAELSACSSTTLPCSCFPPLSSSLVL